MKNEKFCFSKGTGLIALVGILLVGFVFVTQMVNQQKSTSTKAAGECTYRYNQVKYTIADGQCFKDVITEWSTSFKCIKGSISKQDSCNPVAPTTGCTYKYNGVTFNLALNDCLKDQVAVTNTAGTDIDPPSNSLKCVPISVGATKGYMTKQKSCDPLAGVTVPDCTYKYNGVTFEMSVDDCLKDHGAVVNAAGTAINPPSNSLKCIRKGYVAKENTCDPTAAARAAETGCKYKYGGEEFVLAVNACLKDAAAVNGVNPPVNSTKCMPITGKNTGYTAKDNTCAPTCLDIGEAGYKCGTVAFGDDNAAGTGTCKCVDPTAKGVNPAIAP